MRGACYQVRLFDTSDAYCRDETEKHHNERLLCKALASYRNPNIREEVRTHSKEYLYNACLKHTYIK